MLAFRPPIIPGQFGSHVPISMVASQPRLEQETRIRTVPIEHWIRYSPSFPLSLSLTERNRLYPAGRLAYSPLLDRGGITLPHVLVQDLGEKYPQSRIENDRIFDWTRKDPFGGLTDGCFDDCLNHCPFLSDSDRSYRPAQPPEGYVSSRDPRGGQGRRISPYHRTDRRLR